MRKNWIKTLLLLLIVLLVGSELDAQRSRTKTRSRVRGEAKEATPTFAENLNYEIKFGNVGLGNAFTLALKPSVGYKFHKYGSAGIGARTAYTFINRVGAPDLSFFDYGFFGYGRARLGNSFYLQGEYTTYSIDNESSRTALFYPLFGGGYVSGFGDWTFGVEVLFIGSEAARDQFGSVIEWWFSASYNF